jgi:hypothetical protein
MSTVQIPNRLALQMLPRKTAADRIPGTPGPSASMLRTLALGSRRVLGALLLLLGILMIFTLLLLPVGLPLALFAVALIAAPGSSWPDRTFPPVSTGRPA